MAETLTFLPETALKEERYESLIPQVKALVNGESDLIANLANVTAALKYGMDFFWVGFYLVKNESLVLGPFQGPVACTRIGFGKGVCGKAWEQKKTIIVPNVDEFEGHIACSSLSKSEIVIPIIKNGEVKGVLDIDSDQYSTFDNVDENQLREVIDLIAKMV
jgi:L-methionine (R)-S-oxide reductase